MPESPPFQIERVDRADARAEVRLAGRVALADAGAMQAALLRAVAEPTRAAVVAGAPPLARELLFDLSRLEAIDGGALALFIEVVCALETGGARLEVVGASGHLAALVDLFRARLKCGSLRAPPTHVGILDSIGRGSAVVAGEVASLLEYLGEGLVSLLAAIRRPSTMNWPDVARMTERAGADGLPIIALISFLVGLILAFQGAIQAKPFGLNIYVADVVALGITRQLGPLMIAILVAGRSGAAFAAELGTMKVSEEVDALRTLGLDPFRFLVFPRVLALLIAVPILTLIGDAIGLVGGFFVGITALDLAPNAYILETQRRLQLWDVGSGLLMSVVFAFAIGAIACERGLSTTGGAEGVGRSTTSSVVTILFHLVVIDAAFTFIYQLFGL